MTGLTLTPEPHDDDGWWDGTPPGGALGERVGIDGVLGDLSRRAGAVRRRSPHEARGFGWDRRDGLSREWWPQGLTTSQDSGSPPPADRQVLLAGWYRRAEGKADTASRVSVVDLGPEGEPPAGRPAYEHMLLVEAADQPAAATDHSAAPTHRQVRVHAGGLAWWGTLLLVADTRKGLRVFDLRDVVRARPGLDDASGCRYLLPQRGRWLAAADGMRPLRWSFCSLDRTSGDGVSLVAGEYSHEGTGSRLARFTLPEGRAMPVPLRSAETLTTDIPSMQGACRVAGTYLVSASSGRLRRGHLWSGGPGGFHRHAGALPVGPEDLSWDATVGRLWTQTEYPGRRAVVCVPAPRG